MLRNGDANRTGAVVQEHPCPACGSLECHSVGFKSGFALAQCGSCGTIHARRDRSIRHAQDYDGYYGARNCTVPAATAARVREICAGFAPYRSLNRLLDVGFGAGAFLDAAAAERWTAVGVEVSRPCAIRARARGFEVFEGPLEDARFPDRHFDVVLAVEVIEHAVDPRGMVAEIGRILRPGGLFWATTPHARGLSARLLGLGWSVFAPPEHLQILTIGGARSLVTACGFARVGISTHGVNVVELVGAAVPGVVGGVDRARTSRGMNEFLLSGPGRRLLREAMNRALDKTRLGDSMKISATR
jgi:SAM-dependent methyltransferase